MNHPSTPFRRERGFTLIEVLSVLGIASILSSIAYPSFQGGLQKARRADALVALVQLQISQERWIASHRGYASLAELRLPARSNGGHYTIDVLAADEARFEAIARATGTQARDSECRHMRLVVEGGVTTRASGADDSVSNPPAANRRCWGL